MQEKYEDMVDEKNKQIKELKEEIKFLKEKSAP